MKQKVAKVAKSSHTIQKFYCECCDYTTSKRNNYNKHLTTKKHVSNVSKSVSKVKQKGIKQKVTELEL